MLLKETVRLVRKIFKKILILHISLALFLWRAGYDVWISNQRGTLFSRKHKKLQISDRTYWDFSFHEIGIYDISAQIKHIHSLTKHSNKIVFIGHSLGTTTGLVYASARAEEAKNYIKTFIFMGTTVYFEHSTSFATLAGHFAKVIQVSIKTINQLQ